MSMKNEDLIRLKIGIQADNDRNFLELAILFDKPEFLQYLPKIRNKYYIDTLIKPENFWQQMDEYNESKESKFDFSIYDNATALIEYGNKNSIWTSEIQNEQLTTYQHLDTDANILCYIFHRPPHFANLITEAIVCGIVDGNMFRTTSSEVIENNLATQTTAPFQLPFAAIVLSPTSTDIEIKEQIRKARNLYKTDSRLKYYVPRIDQVNQIRLYRDWYWKSLANKQNTEILKEWADDPSRDPNTDMDESRISKGIASYKNLLLI